ncbi:hypothetical protein LTR17_010944 [Elasticomyces elasticus]|nr:hypothetical protein LTR17_010944 [Elasticomyces elasticus]
MYYDLVKPHQAWNASEMRTILQDDHQQLDVKPGMLHDKLANRLERLQIGLPTCHNYDIDHLREILAKRDIYPMPDRSGRDFRFKKTLMKLVDGTVARSKFHRFLDLPPELRQRVYGFVFTYTDNAYHVQQPAVSRRPARHPNRMFIQTLVDMWPTYISAEHVAMMRHFEVRLWNNSLKSGVRIKVDLPSLKGDEPLKIQVWSVLPEKNSKHLALFQEQVEEQIRPAIELLLKNRGSATFSTREVNLMALAMRMPVETKDGSGRSLESI